MPMSTRQCQFCGGDIRFRMVRGYCVPLHTKLVGCITHRNSGRPEQCYQTNCPICGAKVYFVRHNGGAVWFDELGAPWDKHPCMSSSHKMTDSDLWGVSFLLMTIRYIVRYYSHERGVTVPGFLLDIGMDRKHNTIWEIYPKAQSENLLRWKGRSCYLATSNGILTFLDGTTFQLEPHKR